MHPSQPGKAIVRVAGKKIEEKSAHDIESRAWILWFTAYEYWSRQERPATHVSREIKRPDAAIKLSLLPHHKEENLGLAVVSESKKTLAFSPHSTQKSGRRRGNVGTCGGPPTANMC